MIDIDMTLTKKARLAAFRGIKLHSLNALRILALFHKQQSTATLINFSLIIFL